MVLVQVRKSSTVYFRAKREGMGMQLFIFLLLLNSIFVQENILKIGESAPPFALQSLVGDYVYLRDFCGELRPPTKDKKQYVLSLVFLPPGANHVLLK